MAKPSAGSFGFSLEAAEDRGRLLDVLDDLLRLGDAREDEVRLIGPGRRELDVADLHDALVDPLVEVHVLDALQARLLDLPGDDPDLDVEPAVGDRVDGRHTPDEADEDRDRGNHHEGDDTETGAAVVEQCGEDPGGGSDGEALQVEAQDRPPGRMPLVDHLLSGLQVHAPQAIAQCRRRFLIFQRKVAALWSRLPTASVAIASKRCLPGFSFGVVKAAEQATYGLPS